MPIDIGNGQQYVPQNKRVIGKKKKKTPPVRPAAPKPSPSPNAPPKPQNAPQGTPLPAHLAPDSPNAQMATIADAYKTQTGMLPSPQKMLALSSAGMNGGKLPQTKQEWFDFLSPVGTSWTKMYADIQQHAVDQQLNKMIQDKAQAQQVSIDLANQALTEQHGGAWASEGQLKGYAQKVADENSQFWGDYVVQPGRVTIGSTTKYTPVPGSRFTGEAPQVKRTPIQVQVGKEPVTQTPMATTVFEYSPFGFLPGASKLVEEDRTVVYPNIKSAHDIVSRLSYGNEERFRSLVGTKIAALGQDPSTLSTQQMANMLVLGRYIRPALDGDKAAETMVRSTGYIPDGVDLGAWANFASSNSEEGLKRFVYGLSWIGADPRQSETAFNMQYAKDTRWAPATVIQDYSVKWQDKMYEVFTSAFGDLTGMNVAQADVEGIDKLIKSVPPGQGRIASSALNGVKYLVDIGIGVPVKVVGETFTGAERGITTAEMFVYGLPGTDVPVEQMRKTVQAITGANIADSASVKEAYGKISTIDMVKHDWAQAKGVHPVDEIASVTEIDKIPFIGPIVTFGGKLGVDVGIGGLLDMPTRFAARGIKSGLSEMLIPDSTLVDTIAGTSDAITIDHMLKNAGIHIPIDNAGATINMLRTTKDPVVTQHILENLRNSFGGVDKRQINLNTPSSSVLATRKWYSDPKMPMHTRALMLPADDTGLLSLNRETPDAFYSRAVHMGLPLRECHEWAQRAYNVLEEYGTNQAVGSSKFHALKQKMDARLEELCQGQRASDSFTASMERDWRAQNRTAAAEARANGESPPGETQFVPPTLWDELTSYKNRQLGQTEGGLPTEHVYLPGLTPEGYLVDMSRGIRPEKVKEARSAMRDKANSLREHNKKLEAQLSGLRSTNIPTTEVGAPKKVNGTRASALGEGGPTVDAGIAPTIATLNDAGFETFGSHSGFLSDHPGTHPAREIPGYIEFGKLTKPREAIVRQEAESLGMKVSVSSEGRLIVTADLGISAALKKTWGTFSRDLADAVHPKSKTISKTLNQIAQNKKDIASTRKEAANIVNSNAALAQFGENVPAVETMLANHSVWGITDRTLATFSGGQDLRNYMSDTERQWMNAADSYGLGGFKPIPWENVVNGLIDKWQGMHIARKLDVAQEYGIDQYTSLRKRMVLARVATVLTIVMADEGLRSIIWAKLRPKQIAALFSKKLHDIPEWSGISTEMKTIFGSDPFMQENFLSELVKSPRKFIKNETWQEVKPFLDNGVANPMFPRAARVFLKTFNAKDAPTVAKWLEIYDAQAELGLTGDTLKTAVSEAWRDAVVSDPYFTDPEQAGYAYLEQTGRHPDAGLQSAGLRNWIYAIDKKAGDLMANDTTAVHLRTGEATKAGWNHDMKMAGAKEAYGVGKLPVQRFTGADRATRGKIGPALERGAAGNKTAVGRAAATVAKPVASFLMHPYDSILGKLGKMGTRLKAETYANFYERSYNMIESRNRPVTTIENGVEVTSGGLSPEQIASEAEQIAKHETKKASYMLSNSLLDERLRNAIMFLPAYEQFWKFWGEKAGNNFWKSAAIIKDAQQQPNIPVWIPFIGPMKWMTQNVGFFAGLGKPNQTLPPLGFVISDPLQVGAILGNKTMGSLYETISGMPNAGYPPYGDILDDLTWAASGGTVTWATLWPGSHKPPAAVALDTKRQQLAIAYLTKQFIEGGVGALNPQGALNHVRGITAKRAVLKEFVPGNIKITLPSITVPDPTTKSGKRTIQLDNILVAQRMYLNAADNFDRAQVLARFPGYAPIAEAYSILDQKGVASQMKYLSEHEWVIPFVVRRTQSIPGMSPDIGIFYSDQIQTKSRLSVQEVSDAIVAKYKVVKKYTLDVSYQAGLPSVEKRVKKELKAEKIHVGSDLYKDLLSKRTADYTDAYNAQFITDHRKDLEFAVGKEKLAGTAWIGAIGIQDGNPQGWPGIYQSMKSLSGTKVPGAQQLLRESSYWPAYAAERRKTKETIFQLGLDFATESYKDEVLGVNTNVTLEPGGTFANGGMMRRGDAMMLAVGLNPKQRESVIPFLKRVAYWQGKKNYLKKHGHYRDKEYRAMDKQMDLDLAEWRPKNPILRKSTGEWLAQLGLNKPKLTGPPETMPGQMRGNRIQLLEQLWSSYQNPKVPMKKIEDILSRSPKQVQQNYGEYMRAMAWDALILNGGQIRHELQNTPNKSGWYGNSLMSNLGKGKAAEQESMFKVLCQISPEFKKQYTELFGKKRVWRYIIDPNRF